MNYDTLWSQQSPQELAWLLAHTAGANSILEVGSCFGVTLQMLGLFASRNAVIRSIDLGTLPKEAGKFEGMVTRPYLEAARDELRKDGFDVEVKFDNSHDIEAIEWAKANGPYDFVFIDGDHTYEGVKADWENYGPLGKIVGFHDIAHPDCGVKQLWDEIKASHRTIERVTSRMGIGLVAR